MKTENFLLLGKEMSNYFNRFSQIYSSVHGMSIRKEERKNTHINLGWNANFKRFMSLQHVIM